MAKRTPESGDLKTTVEVMDALGGIPGVSALTGSKPKATENWSRARTFPSRYFLVMFFAVRKKGLTARPELWGQVTPADRQKALATMVADQKQRMAS